VTAVRRLLGRTRSVARGRAFLPAVAVVALALAVLAALLAHDVRSWRNTMRDNTVRYAISPTAQEQWTAPTYLPATVSERLLAVDLDRRWLSALRFFALAENVQLSTGVNPASKRLLQTTENALSLAAQDPNPTLASQAYVLLSVILFKDSKASFIPDVATYAASISAMQNAVRVDGRNGVAEADLELLLRQYVADSKAGNLQQANNQGSRPH
jgi:hypothetical protein